MLILWRTLLLVALHLGVLVAFPNYTEFAPITVFVMFLLSMGGMVALSSALNMMGMSRSFFMNRIVEILYLLAVAIILLMVTPQGGDGRSPWDRVSAGHYPTERDVRTGLARFGLDFGGEDAQKKVGAAVNTINKNLKDAKNTVAKEVKE